MRQAFLLFSHQLTKSQQDELENKFKVDKIIYLPSDLQSIWSNVPPELPSIKDYLEEIFCWLKEHSKPNDIVLVQGEFGAVFLTANFCIKEGLVPIYSTTRRDVAETILDDETIQTKRNFIHVRFREFEKWD
ncbi:conserved protein of unknown function [Tepidanaerobacter acetatoxydans Re1]|uniref:CRISPR-associated protein n=1 Tax=Tepidanaerobacter acetatoxydans (strain DSM 21804 / JCM 16047 / Re1) TaxID=1209989 RepID=F4LS73_TEPAE|nr:CRISPR-associated protein Csx20 [Tepidanaerobacter acetatoxydans]AEE90336.1 hypothetical protein TepRe1_0127 [Tepidanaerobacter acetatoxydans Re1]CDI40298.1 conserved protein of unknown function [Tepidanaerobacter acetatoxydans Re1]